MFNKRSVDCIYYYFRLKITNRREKKKLQAQVTNELNKNHITIIRNICCFLCEMT